MNTRVAKEISDPVFQSYGRCCANEDFFRDFYDIFMSQSDEVRSIFHNTDMPEQRRLLRAGISWLIMYARGSSGSKVEYLGQTHSRSGYDIHPSWYGLWVDALVEAVRRHDPEFDATLESHWREVLRPGIEVMQAGY